MTPNDLARIHAAAFAPSRGWTEEEISTLCASRHVHLFHEAGGFALARHVADETELLTLAVEPSCRRHGIADALMRQWLTNSPFDRAFLEVASDNIAAQRLYAKHGFVEIGRRKHYYKRGVGPSADALLMQFASAQVTVRE